MFQFLTARRESGLNRKIAAANASIEASLDRKIAAANAAIEASKGYARAELAIAESKLAARIAERDAAPVQFFRLYDASVKVQEFICDQLRGLAA